MEMQWRESGGKFENDAWRKMVWSLELRFFATVVIEC